jgi:hypothetical protein
VTGTAHRHGHVDRDFPATVTLSVMVKRVTEPARADHINKPGTDGDSDRPTWTDGHPHALPGAARVTVARSHVGGLSTTPRLTPPPRSPQGRSCGGSGCCVARPSGPGASAPRATHWIPASSEGLAGTALVGQAVLYRRWPVDGWAHGTVAQAARSRRGCRVFARGAVRPNIRVCPRVGCGSAAALAAARRGLASSGRLGHVM